MPQWRAENRALESGMVARNPARFTPHFDPSWVADMAQVEKVLGSGAAQVVDARSAERFRGEAPEPRPGVRLGHMPGSKNVPVASVVEHGRLASPEKIKAAFAAGGVDPDQPIITSCGSGVTAATLWLALDAIGKPPQALYDGSPGPSGARCRTSRSRPATTSARRRLLSAARPSLCSSWRASRVLRS